MPIRITGIPGGDGECFCFHVTEEEYRRIVGEESYQRELKYRQEDTLFPETEWRIYPNDLLALLGVDRKSAVTLEIGVV
jgi:hypothetical protein